MCKCVLRIICVIFFKVNTLNLISKKINFALHPKNNHLAKVVNKSLSYIYSEQQQEYKSNMKVAITFRKFMIFLHFIFFCAFICHILIIAYGIRFPSFPSVKVYQKKMNNIEFPLIFKLCLREPKNGNERYLNLGYAEEMSFYYGLLNPENITYDLYNSKKKIIGWNGYTNGSSVGSVKGILSWETRPSFNIDKPK